MLCSKMLIILNKHLIIFTPKISNYCCFIIFYYLILIKDYKYLSKIDLNRYNSINNMQFNRYQTDP